MKAGDTVAMGFSGSFPALNLAALVAAEVLKLKVIPITSVASSTWGANDPNFTWLDMERILCEEGIITHKSVAASATARAYAAADDAARAAYAAARADDAARAAAAAAYAAAADDAAAARAAERHWQLVELRRMLEETSNG